MDLVIATRNERKCQEIKELLKGLDVNVKSLLDFPGSPNVEEDGASFKENAVKKALSAARFTRKLALADDSGLEVDALNGNPGLHSARFAGGQQNDKANIEKLLRLMKGLAGDKRKARFRCCVVLADPAGSIKTVEGTCEGVIAESARGGYGFGYDPVFVVPEYNQTFAELGPEIKNRISHRAKALGKAKRIISKYIKSGGAL